ncbi:uncharacterized protein EI97DRAFT_457037 [Westerdykella ornata]|uniref:Transcription factor Iwr1 domain-containing protein n=1 Tax=Westerdykella ornata TaxID=318751 RepID=A0A6A6JNH0_WESOR|nr:uncharacterized protein EI97DRAFT_457037 [Westerdykella ornata]KAF2277794.1 hypothetical protein EI97DRAFT_457037 [Westerdykella ornata]
MSANAPQTLSVKRKRGEQPVEALLLASPAGKRVKRKLDLPESESKRSKSDEGTVVWRLVTSTHVRTVVETQVDASSAVPRTPTRRFHVSRTGGNVVLFEKHEIELQQATQQQRIPEPSACQPEVASNRTAEPPNQPTPPRKRPGAHAALPKAQAPSKPSSTANNDISPEVLAQFEKFSQEVESGLTPTRPVRPPQTISPAASKRRYRDRHPEQAAAADAAAAAVGKDPDAMDVDSTGGDYVYDTYVREVIMPDADGKLPEPQGSIGYIVLTEEDEDWWNGDEDTDKEFDTDDEDSNAEEYYANDYPEDELSEDDEFDRNAYRHYRGESDEEYDLDDEDEVEDEYGDEGDGPFSQRVPKARAVYWGTAGEV